MTPRVEVWQVSSDLATLVRRGRDPLDLSFVYGVTEPTVLNTGPRVATPPSGQSTTWTINTPGVYSAFGHVGKIVVPLQTGVTIRDFDLRMGPSSGDGIFFSHPQAYGHVVEHGKIWVDPADVALANGLGIRGRGFSARRLNISATVDGSQTYTIAGNPQMEAEWLGCYIHDLSLVPDPGQGDGWSHNDDLQLQGNVGARVVGCALWGGRTSCIIATNDQAGGYLYLEITDNWLYGHTTEGSTINIAASTTIPNLKVWRNRVSSAAKFKQLRGSVQNRQDPTAWGMVGASEDANTWTGGANANVYMDTGLPVPIQNG